MGGRPGVQMNARPPTHFGEYSNSGDLMSDYTRVTRECAVGELKPELLAAIRAYAQAHELGQVEADALLCCETRSERKKKGFLASLGGGDPDALNQVGLILTPQWLVWARNGARSGTVVSAARLRDVQVSAYRSPLIPDSGLEDRKSTRLNSSHSQIS